MRSAANFLFALCSPYRVFTQVPAAVYLERLQKVNFDAFHSSLQHRSWRLPWRIWRGFYEGRF